MSQSVLRRPGFGNALRAAQPLLGRQPIEQHREVPRADFGLAHEPIEVLGKARHPRAVAERDVMPAEVEDGEERPEDRDRRRKDAPGVEGVDAQARVELAIKVPEPRDLLGPDRRGQAAVVALGPGEGFELMKRHRHLVVRSRPRHPGEPVLGRADGLFGGPAELGLVLPAQHRAGLQHVGQRRRNMADLVARRLLVPAEDRLVDERARRLGHRERGGEEFRKPLRPFGEAEQPVGGDSERGGAFRDELRVRQPRALPGQELRDGRAVHARIAREPALRHALLGHGARQPVAEKAGAVALVHNTFHTMIKYTNDEKC